MAADASDQPRFQFQRLTDDLGGRQSSVYDILQDERGLIWLAGDTDGLLRYDGYEFMSWTEGFAADLTRPNVSAQVITPAGRLWVGSWGNGLQYWDARRNRYVAFMADEDDPDALANNRVQTLMVDRSGRVWVGTISGINLIEPETPDRLRRFARDDPDHPLFEERIWDLVEHDDGIWVATSGGIYWLSPDLEQWRHYLLDRGAARTFERGTEVRAIARVHGEIWAGSQLGVHRLDPESGRFMPIPFANGEPPTLPRVNVILENREGHAWVGAHDGLYKIARPQHEFQLQGESYNLVADVDIRSLLEDREGNLWIGTRDQGLIQGRRNHPVFTGLAEQLPEELAEWGRRITTAVLHDDRGRLWVGVPGGILRRDAAGAWRHWEFPSEIGVRRVEDLHQAPDGQVWIGTNDGLFRIGDDEQLLPDSRVYELLGIGTLAVTSLHAESDGTLWLGLWQYGVVEWHPDSEQARVYLRRLRELRGDQVYQLQRDDSGRIWAATRYSGLFLFNGEDFEALEIPLDERSHEPSFYCVYPEQTDLLWLCTEDGLLRYDLASGQPERFGFAHGLPVERVTGFHLDAQGGAWALRSQGVARKPPGAERFFKYGLGDGLPGVGMQRNAVHSLASGQLVMGTSHGAVTVDPAAPPRSLSAPPVVLSRLWLNGEERTRALDMSLDALSLPHDFRDLTVQVAVLDFHDPSRNSLRYRQRGFEPDFSELTKSRAIRYTNLPPGQYVLEVEGWSSRGVPAANRLELPILVAAPWWQSPLAWVATLLLLAGTFWATIALRERQLKIRNERLSALVDARTVELEEANQRLRASATEDFLTGLLNRRGFTERFPMLQQLAVRQDHPLALILFDLDHFKQINDLHGHAAGDAVLAALADILKMRVRSTDLAARWGGEEFLLDLPDTDADGAVRLCEVLRGCLSDGQISYRGQSISMSASFGVVARRGSTEPLEAWVKAADAALYLAKRRGRDRIEVNSDADWL